MAAKKMTPIERFHSTLLGVICGICSVIGFLLLIAFWLFNFRFPGSTVILIYGGVSCGLASFILLRQAITAEAVDDEEGMFVQPQEVDPQIEP